MDDIDTLITAAATDVALDMERRPPSGSDGIWRFNRLIERVFASPKTKEFWAEVERRCRARNAGNDTWHPGGFGIVASFAQTKAAFATPGFAEARRNFMT